MLNVSSSLLKLYSDQWSEIDSFEKDSITNSDRSSTPKILIMKSI